jgi:hypothetical protein
MGLGSIVSTSYYVFAKIKYVSCVLSASLVKSAAFNVKTVAMINARFVFRNRYVMNEDCSVSSKNKCHRRCEQSKRTDALMC